MIEVLSDREDPEKCAEPPATEPLGKSVSRRACRGGADEPIGVVFCDPDQQLARFWEHAFEGCPGVSVRCAAPSDLVVDALVVPGRSDGRVNEGVDRSLLESAPILIEQHIQGLLLPRVMDGVMADVIAAGGRDSAYLIPVTLPERPGPLTAHHATKSVLLAAASFNADNPGAIRSVAVPNFFPGANLEALSVAAWEMRRAIEEYREVE